MRAHQSKRCSFYHPKKCLFKMITMTLCMVACLFLLGACEEPVPPPNEIDNNGPDKNGEELACPNLDSQLSQLIKSENPLAAAEEVGLHTKDGKLEVMLTMAGEDAKIPSGFDLEVSIRSGDQVQVFAEIDQLCDLSNTDEVVYIRVPEIAVPE